MKKVTFLLIFILTYNLVVAQNYFIKFEGLEGESVGIAHRGWSNIESFNQELANNLIIIATPRRRGTASLGKTISIVKKIDKSSPKIMEALIRGRIIPKVEIELSMSQSDRNNVVIYRYEFINVAVTKHIVTGKESELPTEEITINFEKQKVRYSMYDERGRPAGNVETEYDTTRSP